uniref:Uncharacterized protein n=1 Tax=Anabas testudineus TaxID=64144 RepID=A0A7N6BSH8_ANATE
MSSPFPLVDRDKVPVERAANSVSVCETPLVASWGSICCCYWCYIMITGDCLVVILLSPDESEENNICHVSRVISTYSCLLCFCFDFFCFKPVKWLPWQV